MQVRLLPLLVGSVALIVSTPLVRGQHATRDSAPETVAKLLDELVQPRFLQDAGKFGMERLVIVGHEDQSSRGMEAVYHLKAQSKTEEDLLHSANAARRDYAIGFIHCAHKPGKFLPRSKSNLGGVSLSIMPGSHYQTLVVHEGRHDLYEMPDGFETEGWDKRNLAHVNRAVMSILPEVIQGRKMQRDIEGLFLSLRPVKASQPSCLGCHRGAKRGDTLGVMAYVVSTKMR